MSVAAGLLKKASLEHLTPVFAANGIEKVLHVRNLFKDEAKFRTLVPNEDDRRKLLASVVDRERKETTATGIPQNDFAAGLGGRGSAPVCREYAAGRCKFGASCRYSHDTGAPGAPGQDAWGAGANEARAARDSYVEEAMIPVDMLKFLLKDKAAKLVEINKKFGVSNTRIERETLTAAVDSISMPIRGPTKEAVQAAIKAIHHVVGIESQLMRESRFQYASHELRFNKQSIEYLLAANVKNQGTPLALSPATLGKIADTFRFQGPAKVHHFLMVTGPNDKDKFDAIAPLLKKFDKGIQAILYTTLERTLEMEKRHQLSKGVFPGVTPIFAHREQAKEMRLQNFDLFKTGATNDHGVKQRLLITSDDFAKYAHKVEIPYVNFIIQFCVRPKEFYALQSQCCGRRGQAGISLTFATTSEIEAIKDLEKDVELHHLGDGKDANTALFNKCVSELVFDTETTPLTQPTDYPPSTWKEDLDKEKSAGHVRQEPPKRKPKGKKEKKERA